MDFNDMNFEIEWLTWLFNTREGVLVLFVGGILACLVIAFILERKTNKMFYHHERQPGEEESIFEGLFGSGEEE